METFHRYQCLWIIHSRKYDCIGESHRSTLSDRREFFLKQNQRNNNSLVSRSCKVHLFSHSIFLLVDLWSSLKIKVKQMLSDEKNSHLFWTFFQHHACTEGCNSFHLSVPMTSRCRWSSICPSTERKRILLVQGKVRIVLRLAHELHMKWAKLSRLDCSAHFPRPISLGTGESSTPEHEWCTNKRVDVTRVHCVTLSICPLDLPWKVTHEKLIWSTFIFASSKKT